VRASAVFGLRRTTPSVPATDWIAFQPSSKQNSNRWMRPSRRSASPVASAATRSQASASRSTACAKSPRSSLAFDTSSIPRPKAPAGSRRGVPRAGTLRWFAGDRRGRSCAGWGACRDRTAVSQAARDRPASVPREQRPRPNLEAPCRQLRSRRSTRDVHADRDGARRRERSHDAALAPEGRLACRESATRTWRGQS